MQNFIKLSRPLTFKYEFMYLHQVRDVDGDCQSLSVVKFLDYDPCPAFVIVQSKDGRRLRCLRENIFAIGEKHHHSNNVQLAGVFRRHPVKRIVAELDKQDS